MVSDEELIKFLQLEKILVKQLLSPAELVYSQDNWKEDMNEEEREIHKFAMENGEYIIS